MGLKESGLRASLRNVSTGVIAIPDSENLQSHYVASEIDASDGDPISTWPDSSGSFDATGGDPIYREDEIGGEPALEFNSGNQDVFDTGHQQNTNDPRTMYFAVRVDGPTNDWARWWGAQDGDNRSYLGATNDSGYTIVYADNFTDSGSFPYGSWHIHSITAGSGTVEWFDNGSSIDSASYTGQGTLDATDRIGAMDNDGVRDYIDGYIAEILRYDVDHDDSARSEVESYLNDKYGVF